MKNKCLSILMLIVSVCKLAYGQSYNNDRTISAINHNVPKSPESSSFEKYGKIPVGEYTGTASVNVPLYTLKQAGFELPIDLSYHASGIKVSQEATWVGLGWDLSPGGRITLQVRGTHDKLYENSYGATHPDTAKKILSYLNSQVAQYHVYGALAWGCASVLGKMRGATAEDLKNYVGSYTDVCDSWTHHPDFSSTNLVEFLQYCSNNSRLEPDIYQVNFLGKSLSFYKEIFTKRITMMNENHLYKIEEQLQGNNAVNWIITDDNGIRYRFEQEEKTYYVTSVSGLYPEITTSWLLTQVVLPNEETIDFSYANYGTEYPAQEIVETATTKRGVQDIGEAFPTSTNRDNSEAHFYIYPQYLIKIENKNTEINFELGNRGDISGMGPRKLENILVKDKNSNTVIRRIRFDYSYFDANTNHAFYMQPSLYNLASYGNTTAEQRLSKRLKLNAVNIGGNNAIDYAQTYRFIYNPLALPNKVSVAQDHWGYYNNINNVNAYTSSLSFTPSLASLAAEGIIPPSPHLQGTDLFLAGHATRYANETYAQASMLTSVIYPTGGYSNFEYELHQSYLNPRAPNFKGGGLRVKRISNFSATNTVESIKAYEYKGDDNAISGIYLGAIDYLSAQIDYYYLQNTIELKDIVTRTLHSNGNLNAAGASVAYGQVKTTYIDHKNGNNNYSEIKYFNAAESRPVVGHGEGAAPDPYASFVPWFMYLAPTPEGHIAGIGKLSMEKQLNSNDEVVRTTNYFYKQNVIKDGWYSYKVRKFGLGDVTKFNYVFEPVRGYFTTLDSTVTRTYENGQKIVQKSMMEYNSLYQLTKTISNSSNGGTVIEKTTTPLSYTLLPEEGYDGLILKNIVNVPIEKVLLRKPVNGTEAVVGASFFKYDFNGNMKSVHQLETPQPIIADQFQQLSFGNNSVVTVDSRYRLKQDAKYYDGSNLIKQLTDNGMPKSFIYDMTSETLLAMVNFAKHEDIAYTSFESESMGNWQIVGGTLNTAMSHTGRKSYHIGSGSINAVISSGGKYILSYWTKGAGLLVNGDGAISASASINGWNFYQHQITMPVNGQIALTGNETVDELRLYPAEAKMVSYTYGPMGIETMTDEKNQSALYAYDNFGRLKNIRDHQQHILKEYHYNYVDNSGVTPGHIYFSTGLEGHLPKACPPGQEGSLVFYKVPENKYVSFISQQDANQKAQNDFNLNGQQNANNLGTCKIPTPRPTFTLDYSIPAQATFFLEVYDETSNTWNTYQISGSGSLQDIPGGSGSIAINDISYTTEHRFILDGVTQTGMRVVFDQLIMNGGSKFLYIEEL